MVCSDISTLPPIFPLRLFGLYWTKMVSDQGIFAIIRSFSLLPA
jgi:hypothetical protein